MADGIASTCICQASLGRHRTGPRFPFVRVVPVILRRHHGHWHYRCFAVASLCLLSRLTRAPVDHQSYARRQASQLHHRSAQWQPCLLTDQQKLSSCQPRRREPVTPFVWIDR